MARRFCAGVASTVVALCTLLACSNYDGSSDDEHDDNNFRGDVIECEDALARLERCCPDFDPTPVVCNYFHSKSSGCGSTSTSNVRPALERWESACIRDMSCDELVANKVCERAQVARAYESQQTTSTSLASSTSTSDTHSSPPHTLVCP